MGYLELARGRLGPELGGLGGPKTARPRGPRKSALVEGVCSSFWVCCGPSLIDFGLLLGLSCARPNLCKNDSDVPKRRL